MSNTRFRTYTNGRKDVFNVMSYVIVNVTEIHKFKAKDSEIAAAPLCLGSMSKDWSVDNMKKNWIKCLCL